MLKRWENVKSCYWNGLGSVCVLGFHRILPVGKTSKIIWSKHCLISTMPTNPHPSVPHLHISWTPPGTVTPPPPWAACANASPLFLRRNLSWHSTWTPPGATSGHCLLSYPCLHGRRGGPQLCRTSLHAVGEGSKVSPEPPPLQTQHSYFPWFNLELILLELKLL